MEKKEEWWQLRKGEEGRGEGKWGGGREREVLPVVDPDEEREGEGGRGGGGVRRRKKKGGDRGVWGREKGGGEGCLRQREGIGETVGRQRRQRRLLGKGGDKRKRNRGMGEGERERERYRRREGCQSPDIEREESQSPIFNLGFVAKKGSCCRGRGGGKGTGVIQLAKAKLRSEGLNTEQEDAEADTLEEYVIVLPLSCHEENDAQQRLSLVVKGAEEVENAEANFKYQDKAKELHKTGVNELLIKITESGGLRVDARVLDQVTKYAIRGVVPFLLRGVGDKDDGEDGTIPEVTKTIKDLLQVGVKFFYFQAKLLLFRKFVAMRRQITVANSKQGVQTLRVLRKCEQRAGED
ncbi:hypothetical protein BHE74_00007128 [Ensete ventricosum]|nr:hypothetical protein BHE74_00007128 [Ensete ventricosum]